MHGVDEIGMDASYINTCVAEQRSWLQGHIATLCIHTQWQGAARQSNQHTDTRCGDGTKMKESDTGLLAPGPDVVPLPAPAPARHQ